VVCGFFSCETPRLVLVDCGCGFHSIGVIVCGWVCRGFPVANGREEVNRGDVDRGAPAQSEAAPRSDCQWH
jgi:hypothetical protein